MYKAFIMIWKRYRLLYSFAIGMLGGILLASVISRFDGGFVVDYLWERYETAASVREWDASFLSHVLFLREKQFVVLSILMLTSAGALASLLFVLLFGGALGMIFSFLLYSFGINGVFLLFGSLFPQTIVYGYLYFFIVQRGQYLCERLRGERGRRKLAVLKDVAVYFCCMMLGIGAGSVLEAFLNPECLTFVMQIISQ